ncbi:hypothetical protein [Desulfatibacillum aliphaticivorans]|uniref:hypothetical protein n=1 Tax=Desulfatibacillum aliphaticivorans TaxID=218208 RepID=UPI0006860541|nr:hypothetical protein [Desulfatibacillum aliphaticivorans]
MEERVSGYFEDHRSVYPARNPDLKRQQYPDEVTQIGAEEGLFEIEFPCPEKIKFGAAPKSREDEAKAMQTKYLWVVAMENVPAALEYCGNGRHFERGRLSHTNLTGGKAAHTAGELWFYDARTVVINGGSSRYKPRNSEELASAAQAFRDAGFSVASMGWDNETAREFRFLRGEPEWLD